MRPLVLSLVILLCVTAAQARVIYGSDGNACAYVYDFATAVATNDPNLNLTVDNAENLTWKTSATGNKDMIKLGNLCDRINGKSNKYALLDPNRSQERLCTTVNSGTSIFPKFYSECSPTGITKYATVSYDTLFNQSTVWMVGIWVDGYDANAGSMSNNELEIALQFGAQTGSGTNRGFRVRGANNGNPGTFSGTAGLDPNIWDPNNPTVAKKLRLSLEINLNGCDGSADLTVTNLENGFFQLVINDAPLGMKGDTLGKKKDISQWTGFTIRSQHSGSQLQSWVDNLVVIPEPASLSLLVLGGLAYLRRRR